MEGTCTGEHGIGIHKQDFLREECGDGAIAMMRAIKLALDPKQHPEPGQDLHAVKAAGLSVSLSKQELVVRSQSA